jgi:hypothetical protein
MKQLVLLFFFLQSTLFIGQNSKDSVVVSVSKTKPGKEAAIVYCSERLPEYIGGQKEYFRFLKANFNRNNMSDSIGYIIVQFAVNERGDVENPVVLQGLAESTNKECLRILRLLKYTPACLNGRPIPYDFIQPINIDYDFDPFPVKKKKNKK